MKIKAFYLKHITTLYTYYKYKFPNLSIQERLRFVSVLIIKKPLI